MLLIFEEKIASTQSAIFNFLTIFKNKYLKLFSDNQVLRDRIEYVLTEAVENAYQHGNRQDYKKFIHIYCWHDTDQLMFSVEDEGEGFDGRIPSAIPSIAARNGRGLFSIKEFTESLSLNAKGNKITFTFKTR